MALPKNSRPSGLLIAIVVIAALYLARVVFIPLALALLFSLLLTPLVSFLERIRLPRIVAIFLVVLTLLSLLGVAGWRASRQILDLTEQLPTYKTTLEDRIHSLRGAQGESLNKASQTVQDLAKEVAAAAPGSQSAIDTKKALGSSPAKPMSVEVVPPANPLQSTENLLGPLVTAGVIAIFTIFILIGREDLRNRFIRLAGWGSLNAMTQALDDATRRINRYLLLQLVVNGGCGIVIGLALHFIGIPYAPLWGLVAAILRFLPYVGPPLAAVMPILLSLAVFSGWGHALATMGILFTLELVVSNLVEPPLYGTHVGLSPLAILVAAIFWTLIWGFPGLLLSTPLTVCLVVMGHYIPSLSFLGVLLGDEPVLSPHVQYYQRLLAADQNEARQILQRYLKEKPLQELYGSVVIPALSLAEQDRHANILDEQTQTFIYQSTREIIDELDDISAVESAGDAPSSPEQGGKDSDCVDVVCIPARDEADSVIAILLARLIERQGQAAKSIPIGATVEMLAQVAHLDPKMVCISALPPFAFNHARELYAKLRTQSPHLPILVCLWHFDQEPKAAEIRLKLAEGDGLFTTLPQVLYRIALRARTENPA
jgi:predicted PurR-regulated permease PerM